MCSCIITVVILCASKRAVSFTLQGASVQCAKCCVVTVQAPTTDHHWPGPSDGAAHRTAGGGGSRRKAIPTRVVTSIIDGLKQIYFQKVKPLEEQFKFGSFFSPLLHESDFEAKPSVLLLGQYSTGKLQSIGLMGVGN